MTSTNSLEPFARYGLRAALSLLLLICAANGTAAASTYDISIDTSSLVGTSATLAFDFIAGGGTQSNSIVISGFSTDGVLGAIGPNSGTTTGALPNGVTLSTQGGTSFFNESLQGLVLGSTVSFRLNATNNSPTAGAPDSFAMFILDSAAASSLIRSTDPTGSNSLFGLQIDGSSNGVFNVYHATPGVPVTFSPVPLPPSIGLLSVGLLAIGMLRRRTSKASRPGPGAVSARLPALLY